MELVYLWVEDYKNIHKQGFNFSPRFSCKYDDVENELTIKENDDYIENFFGENINVTAIVGKNGSGKSRLLNYLDSPFTDKNNKLWIYKEDEKYYCFCTNKRPIIIESCNLGIEFAFKEFSSGTNWIALDKNIGEKFLPFIYMDGIENKYNLDANRKNNYNMEQNSLFIPKYIRVNIEYSDLFYSLKSSFYFDTLRLILKDNSTKFLSNFINKELSKYKDKCAVSTVDKDKILLYEENDITDYLIAEDKNFQNKEIVFYDKNRQKLVEIVQEIEKLHRKQTSQRATNYKPFQVRNKFSEFELALLIAFIEGYLKRHKLYISSKFLCDELEKLKNKISAKIEIKLTDKTIYRITENYMLDFFKKLSNKYSWDIFSYPFTLDELIVATEYINAIDVNYSEDNPYIDIPINAKLKNNIKNIAMFQKVFQDEDILMSKREFYLRIFELDMINSVTEAKYETISDGEKQFLKFSVDLISLFKDIHDNESIMILADEIDNHLHPLWKKRVLFESMKIFKQICMNTHKNINVHMIFSTHSPFLLSDIPVKNIIFLDTYQEEDVDVKETNQRIGNCKVLTHDEVLNKKQTFGANIHTLLSDSFFMKDGLMGEFAKGKINAIKSFYELSHKLKERISKNPRTKELAKKSYMKRKKRFEQIQKIIGEPFLQRVIKNYLDELELLFSDDNTLIEKELADIEKRKVYLESLRNAKN